MHTRGWVITLFVLLTIGIMMARRNGSAIMNITAHLPRGFRNNNPLNIEYNPHNQWDGQTGVEPKGRFATFETMEYGIRAGAKLIKNYMDKYHLNTVYGLINRWAPHQLEDGTVENPTHDYARYVAHHVGVDPYQGQVSHQDIPAIITAMVKFESGASLSSDVIERGVTMAGV